MPFVIDSMMAADGVSPATKARVVMPDMRAGTTVCALGSKLVRPPCTRCGGRESDSSCVLDAFSVFRALDSMYERGDLGFFLLFSQSCQF